MLWTDEYCFLHYPKTAGKSLTKYFLTVWPRPIWGLVSRGQLSEVADLDLSDVNLEVGRGHENITQAARKLEEQELDILGLSAIFVTIRNPYDLMVSTYFYMREHFSGENLKRRNFQIANACDFKTFCSEVGVASPKNWVTLNGEVPKNLEVIRFEKLEDEILRIGEKYNFSEGELPFLNPSSRGNYRDYYDRETGDLVYGKLKYLFDLGCYEREQFPG